VPNEVCPGRPLPKILLHDHPITRRNRKIYGSGAFGHALTSRWGQAAQRSPFPGEEARERKRCQHRHLGIPSHYPAVVRRLTYIEGKSEGRRLLGRPNTSRLMGLALALIAARHSSCRAACVADRQVLNPSTRFVAPSRISRSWARYRDTGPGYPLPGRCPTA